RLLAVGPNEFVRPAERGDPLLDSVGEGLVRGLLAGGQRDQTADHGEDVLDPVAQLAAEYLDLLGVTFALVDVGACAHPAHDPAFRVADRHGPAESPTILAASMAQPVFDLVGLAGLEAVPPALPRPFAVVRVEHSVPR